ncbi:MAG: amidase [Gammaproteobacteria bacterium]|nr:amidase [Gammaproteobacteria bacterium]
MMPELCRLSAEEAVRRLKAREVSPVEMVDAAIARIEAVDGVLNAIPTRCFERAHEHAKHLMAQERHIERPPAWLGGLPIAVKDLTPVGGVRTTYGSRLFAEHVPQRSDLLVDLLEANGAIVIGKSNTPEFGAGASTFNDVFGITRNPWNPAKSAAGSSGGSAAALASGEVWLATGSDLGGSLRTPASFNGIVGLRPSPGRVPRGPVQQPFETLSVGGPMARTATDAALLLDAMLAQHPEDPLSLEAPAVPFAQAVGRMEAPRRVAFSPDLGLTPVHATVRAVCESAAAGLAHTGIDVEEACPDFTDAQRCFQVLRAMSFVTALGPYLDEHRELLKPEIVWNIEQGLALGPADLAWAQRARTRLYYHVVEFFRRYDLLLCPAAIVPPFDAEVRYVEEVEGRRFDNYVDWIAITYAITLTSCPAVSVPVGLTADGLPVGLQIVGPPRGEAQALGAARLLEELAGLSARLPVDP